MGTTWGPSGNFLRRILWGPETQTPWEQKQPRETANHPKTFGKQNHGAENPLLLGRGYPAKGRKKSPGEPGD